MVKNLNVTERWIKRDSGICVLRFTILDWELGRRLRVAGCVGMAKVAGNLFMKYLTLPVFLRRGFLLAFALGWSGAGGFAADSFPDAAQLPSQPGTPDPLVMRNGTRVTTKAQWFQQRRPELKALFQHYMYGAMPSAPEQLHFEVNRVDTHFFGGKATKKEVTIRFSTATNAPVIHLLLVIPNARALDVHGAASENIGRGAGAAKLLSSSAWKSKRGAPVFVGLNYCGNHMLVADTNVALPTSWLEKNCPGCVDHQATEVGRGSQSNIWNIEQSIDRGYAVATFYCADIEPDMTNATTGLRAFLASDSACASGLSAGDCGTIEAWAWGMSRAVDYLVTDKLIDAQRIAVVGHSRFGKASILAAAFDERFALAVPLQAGCGGTAPSRGKIGESVKAINNRFPHWFNGEFKKFNEQVERLPFDQNCLIALVAPRPVLIGGATGDTWTNPAGAFEMMQAADPVYRLLGVKGLGTREMPGINHLVGERLGFFMRPGKHSMLKSDWQVFLDFADREMGNEN